MQPGDRVHRGDLVAVVKTDKADVEVEVFDDGVIGELLVPVGDDMLPIGTPLATIVDGGPMPRRHRRRPARRRRRRRPAPPAPLAPPPPPPPPAPRPGDRPLPTARQQTASRRRRTRAGAAAELGVDLATRRRRPARPSDQRRRRRARRRRGSAGDRAPAPVDQASAMRRAIGNLMARSKREIPHYYLEDDIELTHALAWLAQLQRDASRSKSASCPRRCSTRPSRSPRRDMPALNGYWIDGAFVPGDGVHLGVAIALRGGGLVAPAIHDADQLLARRADGAPARPHRPRRAAAGCAGPR